VRRAREREAAGLTMVARHLDLASASPDMSRTRTRVVSVLALLVVVVPVVAGTLMLRARWNHDDRYELFGDEPHYLVAARALVYDRALELSGSYGDEFREGRFYADWQGNLGLRQAHVVRGRNHGAYSVHGLGLPLLLAPGLALFGIAGARLTMLALAACVVVICWFAAPRGRRVVTTIALTWTAPLLAHGTQIYPDIAGGVILGFATLLVAARTLGRRAPRGATWLSALALALAPWIHTRFAIPALLAGAALAYTSRRAHRALLVLPVAVSGAGLAAYNLFLFGELAGGTNTARTEAGSHAAMVVLGLHFDALHGMFAQHPLLLFALPGLVVLWQHSRFVAAFLVVLHLALVVPNALHTNWYGGLSFVGRFEVAASVCALVPAAIGFGAFALRFRVVAIVLAGASVALNLWNYVRIRDGSFNLYNRHPSTPVADYGAWLPLPRRLQPALYDIETAWSISINRVLLLALMLAVALCVVAVAADVRHTKADRDETAAVGPGPADRTA
jgi:hypothetical protein